MRGVWWLIKIGWRAATRARRFFGPSRAAEHPTEWMGAEELDVMGGPLEAPTVTPIGNLHDLLEGVPGRAVSRELEQLEELAIELAHMRKGRG